MKVRRIRDYSWTSFCKVTTCLLLQVLRLAKSCRQNRELNLGLQSSEHVGLVLDWFTELWGEAEPFDLAALYEHRWDPHNPGIVFLRMLNELYGSALADELDDPIGLPVTEFQNDGIRRALRLIDQLGGTLVCDEVGLGKTFIAGDIRRVSQIERQRSSSSHGDEGLDVETVSRSL